MASLITVRLNKGDSSSLGFRLQGGKDFGTPLVIQKVSLIIYYFNYDFTKLILEIISILYNNSSRKNTYINDGLF